MRNLTIKAAAWAQTRRFHQEEEGQTVIEYALVVGVVSVALIALMAGFGSGVISKATSKVASLVV
jgi:Flp pilus assembly pilin Flp